MITLEGVSKRYIKHWIFKDISYKFLAGQSYAILGANGSGKSTLLRVIGSMLSPSKGTITYPYINKNISTDTIYKHLTYCAPGMDIIEEMTLFEFFNFHFKFKKNINNIAINDLIDICQLDHAKNQLIRDYSSGMRQRVKLAQAFFSESSLILLDEPCTNLDNAGITLYQSWLSNYGNIHDRITIIASNDEREYSSIPIENIITVSQYK